MAPYYILISIVAAVSYFIIKKYLPIKGAIGISLLGFVLTAIFPLVITRVSPLVVIIIYIIIGLLASVVVKRMELTDSKHNDPVPLHEFEAVIAETAATAEQDLETPQQYEPLTTEEEFEQSSVFGEEEVIDIAEDDIYDRPLIEEETEVDISETLETKLPQPEPQLEDVLEQPAVIEEISAADEQEDFSEAETESEAETDSEEEYDIPDSYSYAGITRSIIVEPEVQEPEQQLPEPVMTETVAKEQLEFEPESEPQEENQHLPAESVDDDLLTDLVEETETATEPIEETTTPIEPVVEVLTDKQLISNGLSQSRVGNYNDAVKMLMEALKQEPEPKLKYLAVSEISTIYQHIGFYQLAASVLAAYIKQRDLQDHPGLTAWQEKLVYLNTMINLLKENKLSSLPYNEVPDFIKKKAFSMTLEKINK